MQRNETPMVLVDEWKNKRNYFFMMEKMKERQHDLQYSNNSWPAHCYIPLHAAYTMLAMEGSDLFNVAENANVLTACWIWQQHKAMYSFDPDFSTELSRRANLMVENEQVLPVELLLHPPFPAIYIKAPNICEGCDGFWYWVDYDMHYHRSELRFVWLQSDMTYGFYQVLELIPNESIQGCLKKTNRTGISNVLEAGAFQEIFEKVMGFFSKEQIDILSKAIQHVLYIQDANCDIDEVTVSKRPYKKNKNKSKVTGALKEYNVGVRVGNTIRDRKKRYLKQQNFSGTGSKKCPHIRSGHWHPYWTGPRKGPQKLVRKWVESTYIHADEFNPEEVTLHPVETTKNKVS